MDAVTAGLIGVAVGFFGNWLRDWTQHRRGRQESRRGERLAAYSEFLAATTEYVHSLAGGDSAPAYTRWNVCWTRAYLVASKDTRSALNDIRKGVAGLDDALNRAEIIAALLGHLSNKFIERVQKELK